MGKRDGLLRRLLGCGGFASRVPAAVPDPSAQVASVWGQLAHTASDDSPALPAIWTSHPVVRAEVNRRLSGRPDTEWLAYLRERFFPRPVARALVLGCGGGQLEREAIRLGLCTEITGVDLSEEALELARGRAEAAGLRGITYRAADINHLVLPRATYDLVLVKQALHHIERLEQVLDGVRETLRPGGWFVLNEYVGPCRFQWTQAQLDAANRLLAELPESLRRVGDDVRRAVTRAPAEEIASADPSEAVRSVDILPLLEARFIIAARWDLGGTILNPLLQGIITNFDPRDEGHCALLRHLSACEEALLAQRLLTSDFVVLMAKPRP